VSHPYSTGEQISQEAEFRLQHSFSEWEYPLAYISSAGTRTEDACVVGLSHLDRDVLRVISC
jgi:hypothetical protein